MPIVAAVIVAGVHSPQRKWVRPKRRDKPLP